MENTEYVEIPFTMRIPAGQAVKVENLIQSLAAVLGVGGVSAKREDPKQDPPRGGRVPKISAKQVGFIETLLKRKDAEKYDNPTSRVVAVKAILGAQYLQNMTDLNIAQASQVIEHLLGEQNAVPAESPPKDNAIASPF